jgi:UDP-glucose 6-dehydrogenase
VGKDAAKIAALGKGVMSIHEPGLEAVVAVNDARKLAMARKVEAAFGGVKGKTNTVLGLT